MNNTANAGTTLFLTQNAQKSARALDKAAARAIIVRSFVRSFVRSRSVKYTQNTTQFFSHNKRTERHPFGALVLFSQQKEWYRLKRMRFRHYGIVEFFWRNYQSITLKMPRAGTSVLVQLERCVFVA
ncbi:hypothetical protein [Treponema lecithinolyticum]|uniref:Uncharacterized protein n=1 Tax=Treponema lecithinolyticum ATCC 700332 TaxID=1321815 RepID=A0ABN0NYI0_TRELE|nr:hypothetical protein [Treponema lecithinolyticum]ERJ93051.1 hypothetical protein HMPREF9193_01273 [Treponema lecithinolyticum ATCC 700332]